MNRYTKQRIATLSAAIALLALATAFPVQAFTCSSQRAWGITHGCTAAGGESAVGGGDFLFGVRRAHIKLTGGHGSLVQGITAAGGNAGLCRAKDNGLDFFGEWTTSLDCNSAVTTIVAAQDIPF